MTDALVRHVTMSDTAPDGDGQHGTARSWCLACSWSHELRWSGPAYPYESNALMLTQAHGTAHEREQQRLPDCTNPTGGHRFPAFNMPGEPARGGPCVHCGLPFPTAC